MAADTAIAAISKPQNKRAGSGQGFGLLPEEIRAVDKHAMSLARSHLQSLGHDPTDVSKTESFDFVYRDGDAEVIVEVKGTTGSASAVLLTAPEVEKHQLAYPRNALIVVSEIQLNRNEKPPAVSGGVLRCISPWRILEADLKPTTYRYTVPPKDLTLGWTGSPPIET